MKNIQDISGDRDRGEREDHHTYELLTMDFEAIPIRRIWKNPTGQAGYSDAPR